MSIIDLVNLISQIPISCSRVKHLILADPWGFPKKSLDPEKAAKIPMWVRAVANVYRNFNPLWPVRFVGPLGMFYWHFISYWRGSVVVFYFMLLNYLLLYFEILSCTIECR